MFRSNALVLALGLAICGLAQAQTIALTPVSRGLPSALGEQGDGNSDQPAISADGTRIVFRSCATNLIQGDSNGFCDLYLRRRDNSTTQRITVTGSGGQANGISASPAISADGRFVAFASTASNLTSDPNGGQTDIFLRDLQTGTNTRVSVAADGSSGGNGASDEPSISADGRYVVFTSCATNLVSGDPGIQCGIFVRDLQAGVTLRASIADDGSPADGTSVSAMVSADGRKVTFLSCATNLVPDDTNGYCDVFVRDLDALSTVRVNIADDGTQANAIAAAPSISGDGRYVTFASRATNLVANDANGDTSDVFIHDLLLGTTARVSVALDGSGAANAASNWPRISTDGHYVAFVSSADNLVATAPTFATPNLYVRDLQSGVTTRASVIADGSGSANDFSSQPALTPDGRQLAFYSCASNLVAQDTNDLCDVFVRNLSTAHTDRVSVADESSVPFSDLGANSVAISDDGRLVAFASSSTNLIAGDGNGSQDVFIRDLIDARTERVSVAFDGGEANDNSRQPALSADGQRVAFESCADNLIEPQSSEPCGVYLHDRSAGTTVRVSVRSDGSPADVLNDSPSMSADGTRVAFFSCDRNVVPGSSPFCSIFLRDLVAGTTIHLGQTHDGAPPIGGSSDNPSLSRDGRHVAFFSNASNLVPGDTNSVGDIFVRDIDTGGIQRVSVSSSGIQSNAVSSDPAISGDGARVTFRSCATNLVGGDANGWCDIFVHNLATGTTQRVSVANDGSEANSPSDDVAISADGRRVAFRSGATNLVAGSGLSAGVYVRDLDDGTTVAAARRPDGVNLNLGAAANPPALALSHDGTRLAFATAASNAHPADLNNRDDVYVASFAFLDAEVMLSNLTQSHDGTPKSAMATTTPTGLRVIFTYNGTTSAPSAIGNYAVHAVVDDPLYQGSADATLRIIPRRCELYCDGFEDKPN